MSSEKVTVISSLSLRIASRLSGSPATSEIIDGPARVPKSPARFGDVEFDGKDLDNASRKFPETRAVAVVEFITGFPPVDETTVILNVELSTQNPERVAPIGSEKENAGNPFNGLIDEVAIFSDALTLEEINEIKDHGLAGDR